MLSILNVIGKSGLRNLVAGIRLTKEDLSAIEALGDPKLTALTQLASKQFTCTHCGKCTRRCEVLYGPSLDMGRIREGYESIVALPFEDQVTATLELMASDYALYNALRQCCFCGYCTAACGNHVPAPEDMRAWRELFMRADLMPPQDSKLVMVDEEWNIFSAYRAIYDISYPEYVSLAAAAEAGRSGSPVADTLLFPGCSLVSYAPEVIRALGTWMTEAGIAWALSDGCCGSPLMSAGLFERAEALRASFIDQMREAGIKRMVTICPGCADEFRGDLAEEIELVPLPELLWEVEMARAQVGEDSGFSPLEVGSLTFFDSCHDRDDTRNAQALRALMRRFVPMAAQRELDHLKRGTLCCGAGGAVGSYDADITERRVRRIIDEGKATGAEVMVTMCPTCAYTIAQANLAQPEEALVSLHYLEILFGVKIDWSLVFYQLNAMWSGEYGPWLNVTFFS